MLPLNEIEKILTVEIEKISINPFQPRREFALEELEELASSIKAIGLIHPPVVRPLEKEGMFELISGERRLRASKLAGLRSIPVLVRQATDTLSAEAALIENVQRVDLNPIELAQALHSLMRNFGLNQSELGERIGKKRSTIANYLRLLTLPNTIQESIKNNIITTGHAKAILSLQSEEAQTALHESIMREGLTVRQTEALAAKLVRQKENKHFGICKEDVHIQEIAHRMQQKLGTKVTINSQGNAGKINIDYYSLDDLDRLINLLGVYE